MCMWWVRSVGGLCGPYRTQRIIDALETDESYCTLSRATRHQLTAAGPVIHMCTGWIGFNVSVCSSLFRLPVAHPPHPRRIGHYEPMFSTSTGVSTGNPNADEPTEPPIQTQHMHVCIVGPMLGRSGAMGCSCDDAMISMLVFAACRSAHDAPARRVQSCMHVHMRRAHKPRDG